MSTPQGEDGEPAPRRPTGVGWPGEPAPEPPEPAPAPASEPAPRPEPPRRDLRARPVPPRRPYQPLPPERPGTVTAAAVIMFISAGLGLLACCGLNVLVGDSVTTDADQNLLLVLSAILLVSSVLTAVLGYYILQGRQWARITTIVLCAVGILLGLISLVSGLDSAGGSNATSSCVGLILNALIIGLLSGSSASDYFRYARG